MFEMFCSITPNRIFIEIFRHECQALYDEVNDVFKNMPKKTLRTSRDAIVLLKALGKCKSSPFGPNNILMPISKVTVLLFYQYLLSTLTCLLTKLIYF